MISGGFATAAAMYAVYTDRPSDGTIVVIIAVGIVTTVCAYMLSGEDNSFKSDPLLSTRRITHPPLYRQTNGGTF